MAPTLGRIVLVRSPAFIGEVPAIVVGVVTEPIPGVTPLINVRAFTNDHQPPMFLQGVMQQSESSNRWGWRWPPPTEVLSDTDPRGTLSQQAPLERV